VIPPVEKAEDIADEDIVHAHRKIGNDHEQGIRSGRSGWITSFLRSE